MATKDRRRIGIAIDVGGTFTDFVLVDLRAGELIARHKVLTNARHPSHGVVRGWNELIDRGVMRPSDVELAVHSTTLVTNSIIERKGAKTVLVATKGFRDILEIGREQMYDIYDLFAPPPEPLIPRDLRLEVAERIAADGACLVAPDADEVRQLAARISDIGAESVAISFLHSYRNPGHEQTVARLLQDQLPDIEISTSSDVAPIAGEYERTSTVAADAYTKPLLRRYIADLATSLSESGMKSGLQMLLSSGEISAASAAAEQPVRLLESGPASGAMAAAYVGRVSGYDDVLSLDMGGTTAKASVIEGGKPEMAQMLEAARVRRFMKGSGLPIVAPVVDLIEIGAGGGSIARADELGLLKVGPDSAGADPGPASYGLGGELPTVTDANLVLGYLSPSSFLGGDFPLEMERARAAIERLAAELNLSLEEAAWGIHQIVNENMAAAARVHVIERNRDPRDLAIVASGGAGPAHAVATGRALGSPAVIFPVGAGVGSALGGLVSPVAFTAGRTYLVQLETAPWDEINGLYATLETQAREQLQSAGVAKNETSYRRWAEMRLHGQYHEIEVELPAGPLGKSQLPAIQQAFLEAYETRYGRMLSGLEIEILHWRLTATGPESAVELRSNPNIGGDISDAKIDERPVYFPDGGFRPTAVFNREKLQAGMTIEGPAIIEERESTIVIWPGMTASVDERLTIIVDLDNREEE